MTLPVLAGCALLFAYMGGMVWLATRIAGSPRVVRYGRISREDGGTEDVRKV